GCVAGGVGGGVFGGQVAGRIVCPLVLEAEGVAGFVGGGFGDIFRVAVGEHLGKDEGDVGGGVGEGADVRDAARLRAEPRTVAADDDFEGLAVVEIAGVGGGDVDVEGRIFFGDAIEDLADAGQFGIGESRRIAVGVVGGRGAGTVRAPGR